MSATRNPYVTPGLRLLNCYILLCSGNRAYTLSRLSEILRCSRQTVLRMMEQIALLPGVEMETWLDHGERRYRVKDRQPSGTVSLDLESIRHLVLCRDIVRHLLPEPLQEEIRRTIGAAAILLPEPQNAKEPPDSFAESRTKGAIDYTPFQGHLDLLQKAMAARKACQVRYRAKIQEPEKTFIVAPMKITAFREALYIRCRMLDKQGRPERLNALNLAIHRIRALKILPVAFSCDNEGDGDGASFFGFQFNTPFQAKASFSPAVATYISERIWSRDQRIRHRQDGGVVLTFTTTSRPETISWLLSFGPEAELLEPADLRAELRAALKRANSLYQKTPR